MNAAMHGVGLPIWEGAHIREGAVQLGMLKELQEMNKAFRSLKRI